MKPVRIISIALLIYLIGTASAELVSVKITNTISGDCESLTLLDPKDGNWIEMLGGREAMIPSINFVYSGINSTQYEKGGKIINITAPEISKNEDYSVSYPFRNHPFYYKGDEVVVKVRVEDGLEGKQAYLYVIKTYPTELKDAIASAFDGDTERLRNLLENATLNESITLPQSTPLPLETSFDPGDYVVVVTLNESDRNITLISASTFQVLEHKSSIDVENVKRSSISDYIFLHGNFTHQGNGCANYTYVAALINKNVSLEFRLESDGTKTTTDLKANDAVLVKSFRIAGIGLEKINATTVYNWIRDIFPPNSASLEKETKTGNSFEFSLPLEGLLDGTYYLNVGAWNVSNSSQRLVAFSQEEIKIITLSVKSDKPLELPEPPEKPIEIIVEEEKPCMIIINNVTPSSTITLEIKQSAFSRINISLKDNVSHLHINITKKNPAELKIKAGGKVCEYLDIETGITEDDIQEALIRFEVTRSWLNEQGVSKEDVVLQRLQHGEWQSILTKIVGETEDKIIYESAINGLSIFAITAKIAPAPPSRTGSITGGLIQIPVPTETPLTVKPVEKETEITAKPAENENVPQVTAKPVETETPAVQVWWQQPTVSIAVAVIIIAAIATIAYLARR